MVFRHDLCTNVRCGYDGISYEMPRNDILTDFVTYSGYQLVNSPGNRRLLLKIKLIRYKLYLCKANQETDVNLQQTIDDIKIEAAKTGIDSKDMALSYRSRFQYLKFKF